MKGLESEKRKDPLIRRQGRFQDPQQMQDTMDSIKAIYCAYCTLPDDEFSLFFCKTCLVLYPHYSCYLL